MMSLQKSTDMLSEMFEAWNKTQPAHLTLEKCEWCKGQGFVRYDPAGQESDVKDIDCQVCNGKGITTHENNEKVKW